MKKKIIFMKYHVINSCSNLIASIIRVYIIENDFPYSKFDSERQWENQSQKDIYL